jgi:hypothetical protein
MDVGGQASENPTVNLEGRQLGSRFGLSALEGRQLRLAFGFVGLT